LYIDLGLSLGVTLGVNLGALGASLAVAELSIIIILRQENLLLEKVEQNLKNKKMEFHEV
jgi:hypothetical protein